jgi:cytosine/adenosine deaminase-related metal-dependent hydrolase
MGRRIGALAPGHRADIVVLDRDLPEIEAVAGDRWLDLYLFVHGRQAVREVYVGGRKLVENGRHIDRDATVAAFAHVVARLAA